MAINSIPSSSGNAAKVAPAPRSREPAERVPEKNTENTRQEERAVRVTLSEEGLEKARQARLREQEQARNRSDEETARQREQTKRLSRQQEEAYARQQTGRSEALLDRVT